MMKPRRRKSSPSLSARREKSSVVTKIPTRRERFKAGHRNECDICHAKIGAPIKGRRGQKIEIWSFTVAGANGKIFNRCKKHLGTKVK